MRKLSSGVRAVALALLCVSVLSAPARAARPAADEAEVRGAVERAFEQLRRGEYEALYDALPTASQRRLPRERFVSGLEQTRNFYELQRLEINAVHVADELAVADTTVYARARMPFEAEGKIVARQYLVREGGRWRVTTGDRAAVTPLLAANPALAKRYPPTQPRLYVKRDGRWVDARTVFNNKRRPAG